MKDKKTWFRALVAFAIGVPIWFFFYVKVTVPDLVSSAYTEGYDTAYNAAYDLGYDEGYELGESTGYTRGYRIGSSDGYDQACDDYHVKDWDRQYTTEDLEDSYAEGYEDGYNDARYGYSSSYQTTSYSYIGNKSTKVFHYSWCSYLPSTSNRVSLASRSAAIGAGYRSCGHCDP